MFSYSSWICLDKNAFSFFIPPQLISISRILIFGKLIY